MVNLPNDHFFSSLLTLIPEVVHRWFFTLFTGFILILNQPLFAQKEGAVWYFGQHAGLDFKGQYPKPLVDGQINSMEGVASISDPAGNLIFYTDGQTVYTGNHQILTNGTGLFGNNTATQSSIIVPWPNHPGKYYLFTVGKVGTLSNPGKGLYYSVLDLNTNQADPVNVLLLQTCTEKITAIRHDNGVDWWILAHEIDTSVFQEFLLSNTLVQRVPQVIGLKHQVDRDNPNDKGACGYLKSSPDGSFVALAIEGFKIFEVFKYDNKTGAFPIDPAPIQLKSESAYGVEFSPANNYLYGTNRVDGTIYRWKLDNFLKDPVDTSREIIFSDPVLKCGALQLALNGKIYVAFNNQSYLGVINAPDLDSCNFVLKGASLHDYATSFSGISGFGLPNLPAAYFKNDIYYVYDCVNDSTAFFLSSKDLVDNPPLWYINGQEITGDETTYQAKYLFKTPGNYLVRMEGSKGGGRVTLERTITIHPLPDLKINDTTYLCEGHELNLHNGNFAFYGLTNSAGIYSDGVRSIDQPGKYTVTAVNFEGCRLSIPTEAIGITRPVIDTIRVTPVMCAGIDNGAIEIVMKGNLTDYTFTWADGALSTNVRDHLKPGDYQVTITIQDGCPLDTTITVTTSALTLRLSASVDISAPVCAHETITLTATGADSYIWEHDPLASGNMVTVHPDTTTMYRVRGSINGECFTTDSIRIQVFPDHRLNLGGDLTPCSGQTVTITRMDYDPHSNYTEWLWSTGAPTDFLIIDHDYKDLWLEVKDLNGCRSRDSINVTFTPAIVVKIERLPKDPVTFCPGDTITLIASGASQYIWSHDPDLQQSIVIVYPNRDTIFKVTGSNGGTCTSTDSVEIRVYKTTPLDLGPDRTACAGDTIVIHGSDYDPGSIYSDWQWSTGGTINSLVTLWSLNNLTLTVKDGYGCRSTDAINLTFTPLPVIPSLDQTNITCAGADDGRIQINITGNPADYQYSIFTAESWSDQRIYAGLAPGTYPVRIRNASGCVSLPYQVILAEPDSIRIKVVSIAPSCPECTDGEIKLQVTGGTVPYSFDWDGYNVHDSIFSDIGPGNYSITITDANGCRQIIFYDLIASELFIPNAFSPNGGSKNEKWIIRILENRPDCLVQVYDRSGKLVYYDDQIYEPWDGTYMNQGQKLPAGTYFYLVKIDRQDVNKPPQRGTVTILR